MSAFFVQRVVVDKAVYCSLLDPHSLIPGWTTTAEQIDELGRELWRLNIEALKQRYCISADEDAAYREEADAYKYPLCAFRPLVALKGLRCWLYQCAEGNVPQTELYCRMQDIADAITRSIVSRLPEYEAAAWDG